MRNRMGLASVGVFQAKASRPWSLRALIASFHIAILFPREAWPPRCDMATSVCNSYLATARKWVRSPEAAYENLIIRFIS